MPHLREIPAGMLDDSDHNVHRICLGDHKGTATTAIPNAWDLTWLFSLSFSFLFFSRLIIEL
jgi:hypothetical protein